MDRENHSVEILPYKEAFREQVVSVWEQSVRATHDFLLPSDIDHYKRIVENLDFRLFPVFCLVEDNKVRGFVGVADQKIEMLFLHPHVIGKGFGRQLMEFALTELHAEKVDVNEQNEKAVRFYTRFGFEPFSKSEKDSEGKNYPIVSMKRNNKTAF